MKFHKTHKGGGSHVITLAVGFIVTNLIEPLIKKLHNSNKISKARNG